MPIKHETSTHFVDELRIISPWAYVFVVLAYVMAFAAVVFATLSGNPPFPLAGMIPLAILGGTIIGCYCLLIGYVNRDAGRREMSRLGWTLLAVCIPNGLGIVLYFVLRKPRMAACPQCGNSLQTGFNFCPRCSYKLSPTCPHCQHVIGLDDICCAYCGTSLRNPSAPAPPQHLSGQSA
jgi:hypothetical protein